jgi:ParB family chromosome partitioning protein
MEKPAPEKKPETLTVNYVAECEKALSRQLGRGVRIVEGKKKGRFELEYYGPEDLQVLLDALMKLGR